MEILHVQQVCIKACSQYESWAVLRNKIKSSQRKNNDYHYYHDRGKTHLQFGNLTLQSCYRCHAILKRGKPIMLMNTMWDDRKLLNKQASGPEAEIVSSTDAEKTFIISDTHGQEIGFLRFKSSTFFTLLNMKINVLLILVYLYDPIRHFPLWTIWMSFHFFPPMNQFCTTDIFVQISVASVCFLLNKAR